MRIRKLLIYTLTIAGTFFLIDCGRSRAKISESEEIYIYIDREPEFPGGYEAMERFVSENAKWNKIQTDSEGEIFVSVTVLKSGQLTDIKVLFGICQVCDEEAIRIIKEMPKWIPAERHGEIINSKKVIILRKR